MKLIGILKNNKLSIAIILSIICYCAFLQIKSNTLQKDIKSKIESVKITFYNEHPELLIEKRLIEVFKLSDERAKICAILIDVNSRRWNIEWEKVAALMRVESRFDYYAKSPLTKGSKNEQLQRAYSLMQIKPTTAKICADELNIPWNGLETVTNPIDNVKMGVYYYAKMNLIFNDFRKNINAYNCGPNAVHKKIESTNNWYRVLYHYNRLKGINDTAITSIVKKIDEESIKIDSLVGTDSLIIWEN